METVSLPKLILMIQTSSFLINSQQFSMIPKAQVLKFWQALIRLKVPNIMQESLILNQQNL